MLLLSGVFTKLFDQVYDSALLGITLEPDSTSGITILFKPTVENTVGNTVIFFRKYTLYTVLEQIIFSGLHSLYESDGKVFKKEVRLGALFQRC
jgi:hypothetical protein